MFKAPELFTKLICLKFLHRPQTDIFKIPAPFFNLVRYEGFPKGDDTFYNLISNEVIVIQKISLD